MTLNEVKDVLATISYKPESGLQLSVYQNLRGPTVNLSLAFLSTNAFSPKDRLWIYLHRTLELETLNVSKLLDVVHQAVHSFEKHEADEWFLVNGVRIFNPHVGP